MEIQARSLRGIGYLDNSKEKIIIIQFFVVAKQARVLQKNKNLMHFLGKESIIIMIHESSTKKHSYELFRNKMFMLQTNTPKFGIQKAM